MRINGTIPDIEQSSIKTNNILGKYDIGDTLKARVISIDADGVMLKLLDGTAINAETTLNINAYEGELLEFVVKNKTEHQLILQMNSPASHTAVKGNTARETFNHISSFDEDSSPYFRIISTILKGSNNTINVKGVDNSFANLSTDIEINGLNNDDILKLKFLSANKIELSKHNIDMLNKILDGTLRFGDEIEKLIGIYSKTTGSAVQTAEDEQVSAAKMIPSSFEELFVKITDDMEADDLDINRLYNSLNSKLHELKENISSYPSTVMEEATLTADNLKSGLDFLESLNKYSIYVQIPIIAADNKTTAELFVLRNKSNRRKAGNYDSTLLISLNTLNLGQINTLLCVKDNNLSINMMVDNKNALDIVKNNFIALHNNLSRKNIKLIDFKCNLSEAKINPLVIQKALLENHSISRVTIDCIV